VFGISHIHMPLPSKGVAEGFGGGVVDAVGVIGADSFDQPAPVTLTRTGPDAAERGTAATIAPVLSLRAGTEPPPLKCTVAWLEIPSPTIRM
jgi:hypothetical protein